MADPSFDPCDPSESVLVEGLEGRPLLAPSNRTRGRCRRCLRKNTVRRELDHENLTVDPTFADGERVVLDVVAIDDGPSTAVDGSRPPEQVWTVTAAYHERHPQRSREVVARPDVAQARLSATVRADGWIYQREADVAAGAEHVADALVLHDVTVAWLSPVGEGTPPTIPTPEGSDELRLLDAGDRRPDWPPETNRWRARLVERTRGEREGRGENGGGAADGDGDSGESARGGTGPDDDSASEPPPTRDEE